MSLFPYQIEGAQFLASNKYAFLADGMGLGKTVQAIEACNIIGATRVVVISPAVARINWQREFELWSRNPSVNLAVHSYDKVATSKAVQDQIKAFAPDVLILDEAHYLKTRTTKRTKSIYGAYCAGKGIAESSARVWLLSGTPCPNNAGELWPHFRALWPEMITLSDKPLNYMEFISRYCVLAESLYGVKIIANKNSAELKGKLRMVMKRRRAEDVLKDLPPISWHMVAVEPDHVLADIQELEQDIAVEALKEALTADGVIEGAGVALASLRRATGLAKAKLASRMIADELKDNAYEKIVVFVQHLDVGKTLIDELAEFGVVSISGQTTEGKRQDAIDRFQKDKDTRVFVGQLQACSTAITLHAANQVVFVEQSWTPSDNAQAAKRCHRIGQNRPVFVRMLGLAKSIDEAVAKVLARKSQAISELLED